MDITVGKKAIAQASEKLKNWGRWGADDQIGTLNHVKPQDIVKAAAWSAADDQVIGRIAQNGMARLAAFLGSPPAPNGTPPTPADDPAPNVAFAPSQTGILAFAPPDRPQ
jgi:hypothetical protein